MLTTLQHHKGSFIFMAITLFTGCIYGYHLAGISGVITVFSLMIILSLLEISLSIDNAIVNAKVLETMSDIWQKRFMTWGFFIAVFGMRLVFPILIVALAGNIGMLEALQLAINDQEKYSAVLTSSHIVIAGFGGAFLFLVALDYFFDVEKDVHWIAVIEKQLSKLGERKSISIVVTLLVMYYFYTVLPEAEAMKFFVSGIFGIITHEIVKLIGDLMEARRELTSSVAKTGLASFMYLEILDASFSFDGVLGALVISKDIFIIMGGLAIGAMFVRSITIQLVKSGTLNEYKYLEHSAFWAILTLATIMFVSTLIHIPEIITGVLSISFIAAGYWHSVIINKREGESL